MASAREYYNLTGGVRRDVVAMVERAVAAKRKGEGLVVHGSQCHGFIDDHLVTIRETNSFDGVPQRAMTLVSYPGHPGKMELTLDAALTGSEGQSASKAAKKWGGKVVAASGEPTGTPPRPRSRQRSSERVSSRSSSSSSKSAAAAVVVETMVMETERVLRARRDASVTVHVRERDAAERERGGRRSAVQEAPSWSSVNLTAEEIFRQCSSGKWWVEEKDAEHIYCAVKQSCNVDKDFSQFVSAVQLHIYNVMKLQGL